MFLRYIKLVLRINTQLEQAKESLFGHRTFTIDDCFNLLDINKSGKLTPQELLEVFDEHNIEIHSLERVIELVDQDDDGTVDFKELSDAITPAAINSMRKEPMHGISVEQRKVYQQAWMESLAHLFSMIVAFDQELDDKRRQLRLAGERIFDSMDTYQQGFVSLG